MMGKMINIKKLLKEMSLHYPEPKCALNFTNAHELLFATILSAQCTDVRVNMVTEKLFTKYRRLKDYYSCPVEQLEEDIRSTGFYRNKAASIRESARMLDTQFGGKVPDKMEELLRLKGVARKTANVVLGNYYRIAVGVVVDTHVLRLSYRMGLSTSDRAEKVEQDLMRLVPQDEWIDFSHRMILHGRAVCKAINPQCTTCFLNELCPKLIKKKGKSNE